MSDIFYWGKFTVLSDAQLLRQRAGDIMAVAAMLSADRYDHIEVPFRWYYPLSLSLL